MPQPVYLLYSIALLVYFLVLLPVVAYKRLRHGRAVGRIADRLGRVPDAINPSYTRSIWIHAVSVGEVLATRSLLHDLRRTYPDHRLLLSTTTTTGQEVATQLGDAVDGVFYAPLDFPLFIARSLDRVAPDLVIFVDTEIWPNWLRGCQRRGVRTVIVDGRISDRSFRGYRLGRPFMRRVLGDLDHVCAQTEAWGHRFVDLGLPLDRLSVTGSLKFDALDVISTSADLHVGDRALRFFSFTEGRPVLVAASTLRGEEEPVVRAFKRLRESASDAVLILAPRHPERAEEARSIATRDGFDVAMRTSLAVETSRAPDVVVVDTVGELPRLFQLATLVFVGGSLVPAGGHNILEPAVFGKAIVFGPHMNNFREIANLFVDRSAALQVSSAAALSDTLNVLLGDPVRRAGLGAAARALVDANKGARFKTLKVIVDILPIGARGRERETETLRAVP
jgi:3-deoxy-D-manno-octulosonic-acid transferase